MDRVTGDTTTGVEPVAFGSVTERAWTLGLVVPCYNEAKRLDVPTFEAFLKLPAGPFLLFVDDGSTDETAQVLADLLTRSAAGRAGLLRLESNSGKAEAVRRGLLDLLQKTDLEYVGFWDADLATPLEEIPEFLGVMRRNPQVHWVLGARVQLLGRDIRRRAIRHYLGRVFATMVSLTLSLPVYDTQCGAKVFRVSDALRSIVGRAFVSRWIFDVEMIARLMALPDDSHDPRRGIYELPLKRWVDVGGSKVRARDFFRASLDLLRIRRSVR
jgi:glycosyltransferase involved in cell wall biosynthesis